MTVEGALNRKRLVVANEKDTKGPLQGLRILDLTTALSGPFATLLLAGLGAEVIKLERPGGSDGARSNMPYVSPSGRMSSQKEEEDLSLFMLDRSRQKKSISLDLKDSAGRGIFLELLSHCDVLVENFTPGTMEKLGLESKVLLQTNPELIYCAISGFGQTGQNRSLRSYDVIVQAMSGLMDVTGLPEGPPTRAGVPLGDLVASLYAVIGVVSGIYHVKANGGGGQMIDVSMLDSLVSFVSGEHFDVLADQGLPTRTGNESPRMTPCGTFRCLDGHVALCVTTNAQFAKLAGAMNRVELAQDARYATAGDRVMNASALRVEIERWLSVLTKDRATALLAEHGVAGSPVRSFQEVLRDPTLRARGSVVPIRTTSNTDIAGTVGPGIPIIFSATPCALNDSARMLGADNNDILGDLLGFDGPALERLKKRNVI